jgi:hypothetical protein
MLAECCRFYHWTLEYCLNMPAVQFFEMLSIARTLKAAEMLEWAEMFGIPAANPKYFDFVTRKYINILKESELASSKEVEQNRPSGKIVLDAAIDEAKYLMMSMCAGMRRD